MREWFPSAYVDTPILKNNVKKSAVPYTSHQFESKMIQKFPGWLQGPWVIVTASLLHMLIMTVTYVTCIFKGM